MKTVSTETGQGIPNRIAEGVERAVYSGRAYARFRVDQLNTVALAEEARRMRVRALSRNVTQWVQTRRTTLFPEHADDHMLASLLRAKRLTPRLSRVGMLVEAGVRIAGEKLDVAPLADFTINRVGINYMYGTQNRAAEVPPHTDPKSERGLVVALELLSAPGTRIVGDNTEIILGHDVCTQLALPQFEHGIKSHTFRVSATFADLRPYPE